MHDKTRRGANPWVLRIIAALAGAAVLALPSLALAQGAAVYQNGSMVPGNLAKWVTNGRIADAGGVSGDSSGLGLGPFSVNDKLGIGFCSNSGVTTGPYWGLCLGHDTDGNGLITVDANNGAAAKALKFRINGNIYDFPGAGGGNMVGPTSPSPTPGNLVLWNGGFATKDGGLPLPVVATDAALAVLTTAAYPQGVLRRDFAAGLGAAPLLFMPLTGTCAANALINDGGICRDVAGGNSFKAVHPENRADARQWGCPFDGTPGAGTGTDCKAALQAAIRNGSELLGLTIVFPAGKAYKLASIVQSGGAGPNGVNIDFNSSVAVTTHTGTMFKFDQSSLAYRVVLKGPAWLTAQTNASAAGCVDVQFPAQSSYDAGPVLTQSKLYCLSTDQVWAAAPYPNSFTDGFRLSGTWYADITDPWFVGPGTSASPAVPWAGVHAFVFYGNHNLAPLIRGGLSNKTDVTFQFLTYTEGTMINGFTDVSSNKGILVDASIPAVSGLKMNGLFVDKGSSFASWQKSLEAHNAQFLDVESILYQQGYDGAHSFIGADLDTVSFSSIRGRASAQPADPTSVGYNFTGTSAHNNINGTYFGTLKKAVALGADSINNTGVYTYNLGTITTHVTDASVSNASNPLSNTNDIGPQEAGWGSTVKFAGSSVAGTFAPSVNQVYWEQKGRIMKVHGYLAGTLTGATGSMSIAGLPRASMASPSQPTIVGPANNPCALTFFSGLIALDAPRIYPFLTLGPASSAISVYQSGPAASTILAGVGNWDLTNLGMQFDCTYRTW